MNNAINHIKDSIASGQPILQIVSYEEKRVENYMAKIAEQVLKTDNLLFWDINNGITENNQTVNQTQDPVQAIDYFMSKNTVGIIIFRDLNPLIRQSPEIIRKLREAYKKLKNSKKLIILLSSDEYFPDSIKKEIDIIHFDLPDYDELKNLFFKFLDSIEKSGRRINLDEKQKKTFIIAAQGLTLDEAYRAFMKAFQGKNSISIDLVNIIQALVIMFIAADQIIRWLYRMRARREAAVVFTRGWGG